MSISPYAYGIMDATDDYKKKYAAYKACEEAGISIPVELREYFDGEVPDKDGMRVEIPCKEVRTQYGYEREIILSELKPGITKIRYGAG